MFWRLGFAQTSPIDQLLDNADVTLQELLDEEDLIQECKQFNKKLIDFLSVQEKIDELLNYVVNEPPEDADDKIRYIYPYRASEVLAADLGPLYDSLFASDALTQKLFAFLEAEEGELSVLRGALLAKVLSALLISRPHPTLAVLQERDGMSKLLRHIGMPSILDLVLKVVSEAQESVGSEASWLTWLRDLDLPTQLIAKLASDQSADVHENACAALVRLLVGRSEASQWAGGAAIGPPYLTKQVLRPGTVSSLLSRTLQSESASALEHGLTVVVALARHCLRVATGQQDSFSAAPSNASSIRGARSFGFEEETETDSRDTHAEMEHEGIKSESVPKAISELVKGVERMVEILRSPPPMEKIVNSAGTLDPPLGSTRLKILEVMQALVGLESPSVDRELVRAKVIPVTLDIFFRYEWHNLMHQLVHKMLDTLLNKPDDAPLKEALLVEGRLPERVVEAFKANDEWVLGAKRSGRGNMGYVRLLASALARASADSQLVLHCTQSEVWKEFAGAGHDLLSDPTEKGFSRAANADHFSAFGIASSAGDFSSAAFDNNDDDDDGFGGGDGLVLGFGGEDLEGEGDGEAEEVLATPVPTHQREEEDAVLTDAAETMAADTQHTPDLVVEDLTVEMEKLKVSQRDATPSSAVAKVDLLVQVVAGVPSVTVTVRPVNA